MQANHSQAMNNCGLIRYFHQAGGLLSSVLSNFEECLRWDPFNPPNSPAKRVCAPVGHWTSLQVPTKLAKSKPSTRGAQKNKQALSAGPPTPTGHASRASPPRGISCNALQRSWRPRNSCCVMATNSCGFRRSARGSRNPIWAVKIGVTPTWLALRNGNKD